jgi:hypothetical protein
MTKGLLAAMVFAVGWIMPASAQDYAKFNFNVGGGMSAPVNPTAKYVGLSGNFTMGAGYNLNKNSSFAGEFLWNGLPPNTVVSLPNAPFGNINMYSLGASYRYHHDSLAGSIFGLYLIGGGGWYYRYSTVDKNYLVPPTTVCQPIYNEWWGYGCDTGGYVVTQTLAAKGNSAGGVNGGAGFTIRLTDSGLKFYVESRYHYAWSNRVPSNFIPVTFGFRFH